MKRIAYLLPLILITIGCASPGESVEAENHRVIRAVFSELWSKGKVELIPKLFSENYIGHFPGGHTVRGRDGLAAEVAAHRKAFPDWTEVVEDEIIDDDRIAVRFRSHGTNTGDFLGTPPTGNQVEISEVALFRLKDGKIAEQWVYPDILSLQRQLNGQDQQQRE